MATSTELLRAAEHMDSRAHLHRLNGMHTAAFDAGRVAHLLRDEAERIQGLEARLNKRSWPEGWPPFAVLRRAYLSLDITPVPSVVWLEGNGYQHDVNRATDIRRMWRDALAEAAHRTP